MSSLLWSGSLTLATLWLIKFTSKKFWFLFCSLLRNLEFNGNSKLVYFRVSILCIQIVLLLWWHLFICQSNECLLAPLITQKTSSRIILIAILYASHKPNFAAARLQYKVICSKSLSFGVLNLFNCNNFN